MLNIVTPLGDHYKVNEKGEIIRTDMEFKPSDSWTMTGICHVKRSQIIPFQEITRELIDELEITWKNGNPQWTVRDCDHGTFRTWGNTKYHGIKRMYFD